MTKKPNKKINDNIIAVNRKASFNYTLGERMEGGLELFGWEVKSIRAGKANVADSYIIIKNNEAFWLGGVIQPLLSASTHIKADDTRSRKLLLHRKQINTIRAYIERKGYSAIATKLYWEKNRVKIELALSQGKKLVDKRHSLKEQALKRDLGRKTKIKMR